MLSIVLIGVSLSMDAFAISVSSGISIPGLRSFYALRSSFFFGLFQFIMPVAGWFLGSTFAGYIDAFDHWVVFALLAFIGGKMAIEALRSSKGAVEDKGSKAAESGRTEKNNDIRNMGTLLTLSAATSIDALAVGVSFSLLKQGVWLNAGIIGVVTLLICLAGFEFGRRLGRLFEKWAGLAGGLMLIGIGTKILIEHLIAG
ncbi:putative manganese efflux pump MntP 2 [Spirochaetia bacterium]|nr:putative manganese efflux pump MntP 2 [Spirochaetia bacterium]